ncbi:MAG: hypothetical protein ABGZ53_29330 [Fuerstiella sp.]
MDRLGNATTHREIGCLRLAVTNLGYKKPTPEGRLIVVEPGRILIRTRRFDSHQWADELSYECPGITTLG